MKLTSALIALLQIVACDQVGSGRAGKDNQ